MKNNLKIRLIAVLLCVTMIFTMSCTSNTPSETTSTPATGTPTSGATTPTETAEPTSPETDEITTPETAEPTSPETAEPTSPETAEPTSPETAEPTSPETDELTTPETDELTTPETEESTTPETEESTTPETEESTTPETAESTESENDEPANPENGVEPIVAQNRTLYVSASVYQEFPFAHYEKYPDILLLNMDAAASLLVSFFSVFGGYDFEETDTTVKIIRNNGAYCELDFVEDSIYFSDFDLFNAKYSNSMADLAANAYVDSEGNSFYIKRTGATDIAGLPIYIDLARRNIPLDIYDNCKYIPFQTFVDLFVSPYHNIGLLFNSKDVFIASSGAIDPGLMDEYYSIEKTERSEALANFTANELCLLLDLYYGLKEDHGASVGFETYIKNTGLWDDLTSTDATESSLALASLLFGYLADKHSTFNMVSPYTGSSEIDKSQIKVDPDILNYYKKSTEFENTRAEFMPDGVENYIEIDNTAYITFDNFILDNSIRNQGYNDASESMTDTLGLIIYAHSKINREGSPIENVVIDISCNTGGAFDAAIYVISWMLGSCDIHITNPITNGFSTVSYQADVNLDGVFDEKDTISDKNLYCLISPVSFSSANLVPALLKESGKVTLIGNTSGGGACAVKHVSTADGNIFALSSAHQISVVVNGSYYSVDRGVEPHFYLTKLESYYDRAALTEFINNLM